MNSVRPHVTLCLASKKHTIAFLSQANQLAECDNVNHAADLAAIFIREASVEWIEVRTHKNLQTGGKVNDTPFLPARNETP